MLTFIDFETEGLNGKILEACAVNEEGDILKYEKENIDFDNFMNQIIKDDNVVVFWHSFMIIYLAIYKPSIFNKLKGQFLIFNDFYSIFNGVKQPKYTIQHITKELTGRDHKGNAKNDALDLYECFRKMQ